MMYGRAKIQNILFMSEHTHQNFDHIFQIE